MACVLHTRHITIVRRLPPFVQHSYRVKSRLTSKSVGRNSQHDITFHLDRLDCLRLGYSGDRHWGAYHH